MNRRRWRTVAGILFIAVLVLTLVLWGVRTNETIEYENRNDDIFGSAFVVPLAIVIYLGPILAAESIVYGCVRYLLREKERKTNGKTVTVSIVLVLTLSVIAGAWLLEAGVLRF